MDCINHECENCPNEPICPNYTEKIDNDPVLLQQLKEKLRHMNDFSNFLCPILNEIERKLIAKNKDYGDSFKDNLEEFGDMYFISRIYDKISRLKSLYKRKEHSVTDESFNDTVNDIIGYCLLYLVEQKRKNG